MGKKLGLGHSGRGGGAAGASSDETRRVCREDSGQSLTLAAFVVFLNATVLFTDRLVHPRDRPWQEAAPGVDKGREVSVSARASR